MLDVCCGTGLAAQAAAGLGASVTGLDISEDMIATAKAKRLACQIQVGDAEALPFGDVRFDRVICNFGLYHLSQPDLAIAEAARVLRPDGVYVFTTWCGPDASPLFRIVPEAIQAHGKTDVGLPPAPPPFRLADRTESMRAMVAAGFGDVAFVDVPAVFECKRDEVIDFLEKSTVRGPSHQPLDPRSIERSAKSSQPLRWATRCACRCPRSWSEASSALTTPEMHPVAPVRST